MLVVVHHRNVAFLFESVFHAETFRSLDVLQIDAAESRRDCFHGLHHLVGVFFIYLDIEGVDPGEDFEKKGFPLHHRLSRQRADVAKAEHGCAVGNDPYEVTLVGVFVDIVRIIFDFQTWIGHSGRIGKRQISLGFVGLCRNHFYFAGTAFFMILQCF